MSLIAASSPYALNGLFRSTRPRSSGTVDPSTIAGCTLWLKADAITGKVDGDSVVTWLDQSGGSNDYASGNAVYKTNQINSLPVLRFSGAEKFSGVLASAIFGAAGGTVFVVMKPVTGVATNSGDNTSQGGLWLNEGPLGDNAGYIGLPVQSSGNAGMNVYPNGAATAFPLDSWGVLTTWYTATEVAAQRNQLTAQVNTVVNSPVLATGMLVGWPSGLFFHGDIAELIVYNVNLSNTNKTNVQTYLLNKYAL